MSRGGLDEGRATRGAMEETLCCIQVHNLHHYLLETMSMTPSQERQL